MSSINDARVLQTYPNIIGKIPVLCMYVLDMNNVFKINIIIVDVILYHDTL